MRDGDRVATGERPLPQGQGGSEVSRSPIGVHRTAGPWTPTVHAFLDHLLAVGFGGAPRVLGTDADGREVLSYVEGEVLADPGWRPGQPTPWPEQARSEEALAAAGRLLRALHDASASFSPSDPARKQYEHPTLLHGEIVCHGDVGPHNTVYREGMPVALIDWETIRPNRPEIEFGIGAWKYVPLGDDEYFARSDFTEPPDLPRRLGVFASAYGITDPPSVLWALQQAKQRSVEALRFFPVGAGEAAAHLRVVARELTWLEQRKDDLLGGLA
jgi:aminoglycoside phosphotransferase (APT) family kinase protein